MEQKENQNQNQNQYTQEPERKSSSTIQIGLVNTLEVISILTAVVGIVVENFSEARIFPILVIAGFVVLAIAYLLRSRLHLKSTSSEGTVKFVNKMTNYSLAVAAAGLMFALERLPGAYVILLVGGASCVVSLLISLITFGNQPPFGMRENIRLLLYLLITVVLLSLEYF